MQQRRLRCRTPITYIGDKPVLIPTRLEYRLRHSTKNEDTPGRFNPAERGRCIAPGKRHDRGHPISKIVPDTRVTQHRLQGNYRAGSQPNGRLAQRGRRIDQAIQIQAPHDSPQSVCGNRLLNPTLHSRVGNFSSHIFRYTNDRPLIKDTERCWLGKRKLETGCPVRQLHETLLFGRL